MTPYQVAEAIQSRFTRNDDSEIVACKARYMSDILGSDWASGKSYHTLCAAEYYKVVRRLCEQKYGALPF